MPSSNILTYFVPTAVIISMFLAFFMGIFLYWRAGRRELVENQLLFDTAAMFFAGAVVFGRLADFLVRHSYYNWSIKKLLFFNVYWGFDIYGAFLGGVLVVWLFLKSKKLKFWDIFDFAAGGLSMAIFLYLVGAAIGAHGSGESSPYKLYGWALGYLLLFWVIKRLEKQKRHSGFFACLFLVTACGINGLFIFLNGGFNLKDNWWPYVISGLVFSLVLVIWYLLAKRRVFADVKSLFGMVLLATLKIKRIITNIGEADNSAKVIVLSPLYLVKALHFLVKYVGREVYCSFVDLMRAFGIKK